MVARKSRKTAKSRVRKSRVRKQRGGNIGAGFTLGAPIVPGLGNSAEIVVQGNCRGVTPGYAITAPTPTGLPGMRGGAYGFDLGKMPVPIGAAGAMGGYGEVVHQPCAKVQTGGVGGVDSSYYEAPRAGFSMGASSWTDTVGAPVALRPGYDAGTQLSGACVKTGGARKRRSRGSKRKRSGRTRKHRVRGGVMYFCLPDMSRPINGKCPDGREPVSTAPNNN